MPGSWSILKKHEFSHLSFLHNSDLPYRLLTNSNRTVPASLSSLRVWKLLLRKEGVMGLQLLKGSVPSHPRRALSRGQRQAGSLGRREGEKAVRGALPSAGGYLLFVLSQLSFQCSICMYSILSTITLHYLESTEKQERTLSLFPAPHSRLETTSVASLVCILSGISCEHKQICRTLLCHFRF